MGCVCVCVSLCCVCLFATPWTVAHQAPLFVEFSRREYWSRLLFPSPGDMAYSDIKKKKKKAQLTKSLWDCTIIY